MDLTKFVVEEPPPTSHGPKVWEQRFESDGWVSVRLADDLTVHAKAGHDAAGRIVVTDVLISAPEVTTDVLRQVNPALVLYAGSRTPTVDGSKVLAMYAGRDDGDTTLGQLRGRARKVRVRKSAPLGRPDGAAPDVFYRKVAEAYDVAVLRSSRPAVVMAEQNDVPVETVRRWIKEARRRGFLLPGRKGRAGS